MKHDRVSVVQAVQRLVVQHRDGSDHERKPPGFGEQSGRAKGTVETGEGGISGVPLAGETGSELVDRHKPTAVVSGCNPVMAAESHGSVGNVTDVDAPAMPDCLL